MNREILFRGKRLEIGQFATEKVGEWVYGGYAKDCSGEYIYNTMSAHRMVKVDPSTVGQWTGMTDRAGKRIFEGDILRESEPEDPSGEYLPVFGRVCFGEYHNTFDGGGEAHIGFFVEWEDNEDDDYSKTFRKDLEFWAKFPYCEVYGNVHDHPEILRGAK